MIVCLTPVDEVKREIRIVLESVVTLEQEVRDEKITENWIVLLRNGVDYLITKTDAEAITHLLRGDAK